MDWPNLNDIVTTFEWDRWEGTEVGRDASEARDWATSWIQQAEETHRDYYRAAPFLILLFLGVKLRPGVVFKFPDPCKVSNARFLQRLLYILMIALLINVPVVASMFSEET